MSRLWSKTRLRLYLAPGHLQLGVIKGRWRPALLHKRDIVAPSASAMELLDQLGVEASDAWRGASLEVVLSTALVRCLWRPWDEGCVAAAEVRAVAEALFEQQFAPSLARDHVLSLDRLHYGQPQLITAVERALLEQLEQWSAAQGVRLSIVAPLPLVAWNRFEPVLRHLDVPLVVIEASRATLLCHDKGRLQAVRVRPCPVADSAALRRAFGAALPLDYRVFAALDTGASQALDLQEGVGFSPRADRPYALSLCGVF